MLQGCSCARCGSTRLELTATWVTRGFIAADGHYWRLSVVLAACLDCGSRERVLPYDALPGKVHSVQLVLGAAVAIEHGGRPQCAVARELGVSRQLVRSWRRGLAARALDLFELQRHRALVAREDTPARARLVRFAAFRLEVLRRQGEDATSITLDVVTVVVSCGGPLAAARLGTELFQQAVLLFRSSPPSTSICVDRPGAPAPDSSPHEPAEPRPQADRALALRAARGGPAPGPHGSGAGKLLHRVSRSPVRWPTGATRRVSLATLYRWLRAYRAQGLRGLRPKVRKDKGKTRRRLPDEVVASALRQLEEDPEQPLTFLLAVLRAEFRAQRVKIPRTTLQRRLKAHPGYERVQRARARRQRRGRFVAPAPHRIWQTDAKGPFPVRLAAGEELKVHVLSVLDDATRAILAAIVVLSPDLGAAVRAFQQAALRWGLPERLYADRASIFDSHAFRAGLADLGAHRIKTKPRNAPVRGKIEAYHRVLGLWFTKRLGRQQVVDLVHLQQLLDGVIGSLYQRHRHRGIKVPPEEALAGTVSARTVPPTRLHEAFLQEARKKAHPTTGEVELQDATWLVPDPLRGKRALFLLDPTADAPPLVVEPGTERRLPLRRAEVRPEDLEQPEPTERWGLGPLQTIYDDWAGKRRPQAEPGFGLPELYQLLAQAAGRVVPRSEREAALVQRFYRDHGPLPRLATEAAFAAIYAELGPRRALKSYLDALAARTQKGPRP